MVPSKSAKKIITINLIGAIALIIGLLSTPSSPKNMVDAFAVAASPKIFPHKADISHPKGTSPWPDYGEVPETDTPEVKAWVKSVNWSKVPKLPIRKVEHMGDPPECKVEPKGDCWWTCEMCTAPTDVVDCPGKDNWGLTFDDGPQTGVTEDLFKLLDQHNVTATFFVTGMKSTKGPWLLQETIDRGHHLASHTWSHSGLTTLTNEQIVAELKWTEKYIFDHTGYKVKYFRPPYGDIDNRVRAVARELGFKTVIWSNDWDTQDWQLEENSITPNQVVRIFKNDLSLLPKRKKGVITLEHDGDQKMAHMARTLLEMGLKKGLKPMNIAQCLGDKVGYNAVPEKQLVAPPAPVVAVKSPQPQSSNPIVVNPPPAADDNKNKESLPGSVSGIDVSKQQASASIHSAVSSAGLSVACWSLAAVVASLVL
ncbi:chitin deacetylase [Mortierella sp. GBA30]|nr:chitin deacetylase [Mortierella sp. GBA30]